MYASVECLCPRRLTAIFCFFYCQVSLDTLRPDRFAAITRRNGLDTVLSSLDAALAHGYGGR